MERTLQVLNDLERAGVARLLAAKEDRRRTLARLPFPDKVRAVVRLQRIVAPVLRARGRQVRVWTIEESP